MEKKISIIGGDLRIIRLVELFVKEKYTIFLYGQEKYWEKEERDNHIRLCNSLEECISQVDIIISGMPFSKDKKTVHMPFSDKTLLLETLCSFLKNKKLVAGGIPSYFLEKSKIVCLDLLQIEKLTILNAIPTVEGAIQIAIQETEFTIHESNVLILGFGRIGKILCRRFSSLGANVYCAARKESDLAWIREGNYIPISYDEIEKYSSQIDLVINTVPDLILNEEKISYFTPKILIIDLASLPGGVDKDAAKRYNLRVITALGIPGQVAPLTAARYIKTIIEKQVGGKL